MTGYTLLMVLWGCLLTVGEGIADVTVSEAEVHTAVKDYVTEMLSDFTGDVEVTVRRRGPIAISGTGQVAIKVVPSSRRSNGRLIPLLLQVTRGPVVVESFPMVANVAYYDHILVASRPIQRGEPFASKAFTIERRPVTTILGRYVGDATQLVGKRAKMRIPFGRHIDPRFVEAIPDVSRGDHVLIEVSIGGIRASADGVASQSGVVGEKIVVQNSSSREKLLAEVIEPGRVRVAF
ncbi:MAG: flagellar basal body P-ring formation chaperone FlgA [Candidatus Latescibacterota bacterium]|nr:flagellar basal body P-ring formation chaperone FlgA [Candidatus Latescibacterota bacterium]